MDGNPPPGDFNVQFTPRRGFYQKPMDHSSDDAFALYTFPLTAEQYLFIKAASAHGASPVQIAVSCLQRFQGTFLGKPLPKITEYIEKWLSLKDDDYNQFHWASSIGERGGPTQQPQVPMNASMSQSRYATPGPAVMRAPAPVAIRSPPVSHHLSSAMDVDEDFVPDHFKAAQNPHGQQTTSPFIGSNTQVSHGPTQPTGLEPTMTSFNSPNAVPGNSAPPGGRGRVARVSTVRIVSGPSDALQKSEPTVAQGPEQAKVDTTSIVDRSVAAENVRPLAPALAPSAPQAGPSSSNPPARSFADIPTPGAFSKGLMPSNMEAHIRSQVGRGVERDVLVFELMTLFSSQLGKYPSTQVLEGLNAFIDQEKLLTGGQGSSSGAGMQSWGNFLDGYEKR